MGVPFENDFIVQLTYKFFMISEVFKTTLSRSKGISHSELFERLDVPVALFYKKVRQSTTSLLERWDLLNKYETNGKGFIGGSLFNFYSSFTWWDQVKYSTFPADLSKLNFVGPSQSLQILNENQHKCDVFLKKDPEAVKEMLKSSSTDVVSFYMRNLDMSLFPVHVQE
jgi:hypothetical protein